MSYKLTTNVIKPTNAIQTLYARKNAALHISWTKVSAAFENNILLHLIERAPS